MCLDKKLVLTFIISILLFNNILYPQQSELSKRVNDLSSFIASNYFNELKNTNSDLALVDSIYLRALKISNFNYSEACLALTFATVPYKKVPIVLPLFNVTVYYPLISASDSIFKLKNQNLPKDLFFDTPQNSFGDKDKLAHFFGSAFISYSTLFFDLGNLIGYFVEVFEKNFQVQNNIDIRDLAADKLGDYFGKILKNNKQILPSDMFIIYSVNTFRFVYP